MASSTRYDKDIDALLNRLHSGCRYVDFEEGSNYRVRKGSGGDDALRRDICNRLRNASPPDETHADLGRGLANSYVGSLHSILKASPSNMDENVQLAIERGDRILRSLCRGSDVTSSDGGQWGIQLNYASAGCAFFERLRLSFVGHGSRDHLVGAFIWKQWQNWCVRCEELVMDADGVPTKVGGGGIHVLNACLQGYGRIHYRGKQPSTANAGAVVTGGIAWVYESLAHHSSRKYLMRTCVVNAFGDGYVDGLVDNLSPLFHSCILRARSATKKSRHAERQLILSQILKACSTQLYHAAAVDGVSNEKNVFLSSQIATMIQYLTSSLATYLTQSIHATFSKVSHDGHQQIDLFELGYEWLGGICDLIMCMLSAEVNGDAVDAVSTSIEQIIVVILPQFTSSLVATFEMAPIYSSLVSCINSIPQIKLLMMANPIVALRLGSLALNLQDDTEINLMIDIIFSVLRLVDTGGSSRSRVSFIGGFSTALGCIFRCRPACVGRATMMYELGHSLLKKVQCGTNEHNLKEECNGIHLMDLIVSSMDNQDFPAFLKIIIASISENWSPSIPIDRWQRRPHLLTDQCAGLLIGLSLLHMAVKCPESSMQTDHALAFIQTFLKIYPRLASRAIPSIVDAARSCLYSQSQMPQILFGALEFLTTPCVVFDPYGAQMVWAFLSSLSMEGVPSAVRSSVLRLLPGICSSNKRLTRRILDVIGLSMVAHDSIIRLSATAALADLAKFDLIRDVESIIGLVQNRLTDEDPAVLYYALEILRYFVVNEELEFDLVVRVLEKRLDIDLSKIETILGLNKLALEGLVRLLGQGGLDEKEDNDDDDKSGRVVGGPTVSPQTIKAVAILVELAILPQQSIKSAEQDVDKTFLAKVRIQNRIYSSLSGYSAEVLGLDPESIRSWDGTNLSLDDSTDVCPEIMRYLCLKDIVLNGINFGAKFCVKNDDSNDFDETKQEILWSATTIGKTLLHFEEDLYGSFYFRGGHSYGGASSEKLSKIHSERQSRTFKSVLSSLPDASKIQQIYEAETRSAAAVAVLYSIGANTTISLETEDILAQISVCIGDVSNESVDSFYHSLQVCSIIHSMNIVWKSIQGANDRIKEKLLNEVAVQMNEWAGNYGDCAYITMAALVLAVDDTAHCWVGAMNIQNTILNGQNNYIFESDDTKYLCLGMVAARLSRHSDARVTGLIDSIEQFLLDGGPQTSFGALFGLGIVNANLMTGNMDGTDPSTTWRKQQARRIMSTLLTTFNNCLAQENEAVLSLASAIKFGHEGNELFKLCSDLGSLYIQDGFFQKMRACLVSIGSSFPVLSSVSSDLLKCVLDIVDKLPWGSGKGFVLHVAYKTAIDSGALGTKDLLEAMLTTSNFIQKSSNGVGDALLSLASLCHISSDKVQRELDGVAKKFQEILQGNYANVSGDDRLLSIIAGCAAIGEVPGLTIFTPTIHTKLKKNFVANIAKTLEEIALNDAEELKYRDASTIGLGVLCAMSNSSCNGHKKVSGNTLETIQAKDGSLMQDILQEVEHAYTELCPETSNEHTNRVATTLKLRALLSTLETVALPGSFSRVIEQILNVSSINEVELKASSIKLLVSQLESRRRIGFDGRGFIDLSTRLAKMSQDDLKTCIGETSIVMKSLPDLIYQIPSSTGEEVVTSLWLICRNDLNSSSSESTIEFLGAMKKLLSVIIGDGKASPKKSISPALQRTLQKFINVEVFFNLCDDAVPLIHNGSCISNVWAAYVSCLQLIPSATFEEADILNCIINQANVFGMATRSALSNKATQKVEYWISLQDITDISQPDVRILLLSIVIIAAHMRNDTDMKESILALFEVMLVKGINTMSLYLLAAKVAFCWESREVHQLTFVDLPAQRVSKMSSFLVNGNLMFDAINLTSKHLVAIFDAFIHDLPSKLAVLCGIWKISDNVSNRASRILNASLSENGRCDSSNRRQDFVLSCLRDIVQLIEGGEI
ncbi:hypothetical protein ACHAXA_008766 [Cyclostephanos tholiformis]|uniref:Uncharacterized protein n=1 Tax=Cyclostephanos tholiformis TaxID=382380 RepID=A0ABD3RGK1_9STRA